jgi:hypothetical protein
MAKKQAPEDRRQALRMVEAILFASAEPQSADDLAARLPDRSDIVLKSMALAEEGYLPGDVAIVDLRGKSQPGDVVCASTRGSRRGAPERGSRGARTRSGAR